MKKETDTPSFENDRVSHFYHVTYAYFSIKLK